MRRVGIALRLYGLSFAHRPWSTFADGDKLAAHNPLRRVPTLLLDTGETLIDSACILDHLDEIAGPSKALIPASGAGRRRGLFLAALAMGVADKAVSLIYEQILHERVSEAWQARCLTQIRDGLDRLEAEREAAMTPWLTGDELSHADIALGCALRFVFEAHAECIVPDVWPALARHSGVCEEREVFVRHVQAFSPPGR